MSQRREKRPDAWADSDNESGWPPVKTFSREEAEALRARDPSLSPWRVIAAQAVVGPVLALLTGVAFGAGAGWSLLYGVATAVVPGALVAHGTTSRLSRLSVAASAVSFVLWELAKIAASVAMLVMAGRIVQPLIWPALLAGLAVGLTMYWMALLWRRRPAD